MPYKSWPISQHTGQLGGYGEEKGACLLAILFERMLFNPNYEYHPAFTLNG
ncbi:hypothetical protein QWZ08_11140 [Ferruginibacter paludis]|uniref:hypothetical protein n=1 Tax=Ferruginibacter paludis TaxID=1310417 RepID=UPI0025B59329|nr:hypothetical protein [Ferruginibacter paludis]MDN3656185.1 hypothetical protein [Ferruginibacter paludis]